MTILETLAAHAAQRVEAAQQTLPADVLQARAQALPKGDFVFERALAGEALAFICECKKASPSRGVIAENYPYLDIAKAYEAAGAAAISVLTEPRWFLGADGHLADIASQVALPCLRKDFLVDRYMIDEAKCLGASAVLLIAAILSDEQLRAYIAYCDTLGLSALVETHDDEEVRRAAAAGARVIGVNNRNLHDFSIDLANSQRLRDLIPDDVLFVAESGVKDAEDVRRLRDAGADAVLIGTALMQAADKTAALQALRSRL